MSHRPKNMRATAGKERNNSCPCGSGLKYKKCCLLKLLRIRNEPKPLPEPAGHKEPVQIRMANELYSPEKVRAFLSRIERTALRGW